MKKSVDAPTLNWSNAPSTRDVYAEILTCEEAIEAGLQDASARIIDPAPIREYGRDQPL
jgi:hypothetical protein